MFAIGSKLTYLCVFWECATPPHIHPGGSLHVISFTRHSPTSVMQVTNTAVKRTGYEANVPECMVLRQVFEQPSLHLSQVNSRKCDDSKVLRHELPSLHKSIWVNVPPSVMWSAMIITSWNQVATPLSIVNQRRLADWQVQVCTVQSMNNHDNQQVNNKLTTS